MTINFNNVNTISAPNISYHGAQNDDKKTIEERFVTKTDNFIEKIDNERKKKKNRIAIAAASGGILLSGLFFVLNPKYSGKFVERLKALQLSLKQRVERNKNSLIKSKLYKLGEKVFSITTRTIEFICNGNSVKDILYSRICTKKVEIKAGDNFWSKIGKKIRNLHVSIMKKPHEYITKCGDNLAQSTVKKSYKQTLKKISAIEDLVNLYKNKLTPAERSTVEAELAKLAEFKGYCSEEQVIKRLTNQADCMTNLEEDTMKGCKKFFNDLAIKNPNRRADFDNNFRFWAQDLVQKEKEKLEKAGADEIKKVVGENGSCTKILEILKNSDKLSQVEKSSLDKPLTKLTKAINNANRNETEKYFLKKKDLVLGSAPTDILSAVVMGSACGIYLAKADTKEERISKTITKAIPIVAGLATNILLTAALWSGGKGLVLAGAIGLLVSRAGSYIDHKLFGHDNNVIEETNKDKKTEVNNA